MAYLGRTELKSSDIQLKASVTISGSSTNTVVLAWPAPNEQSLILKVNGVVQHTDAYSIAGSPTTITLASGNFADGAAVEVVGINDIGTKIVNADGSVTRPKLATTGTPDGEKFLRDDMEWTAVGVREPTNLIINGAMQIAQRSTSVQKQYNSGSGYYTLDRVRLAMGNLDQAVFTLSQDSHLITGPAGFPNSWKIVTDTAETALASDEYLSFQYNIEANSCQHLAYGTSSANETTISFWVKSDITGTYSIMLYAADAGRNIGGTYTIDSADTWEYKTVTFVGDTGGTGINNDTGLGVQIVWALTAGTDRTSADNTSWGTFATNRNAYGQAVNVLASATDYWQITGLQFEIGDTATPFESKTYAQELQACKRYFQIPENWWAHSDASTATAFKFVHTFPVEMKAAPTLAAVGTPTINKMNANAAGPNSIATPGTANKYGFQLSFTTMATGSGSAAATNTPYSGYGGFTADAEIT